MVVQTLKSLFRNGNNAQSECKDVSLEKASVPDGHRAYVIGDIHGRADLLAGLLEKITDDSQDAPAHRHLIYLGDYVDRGHQSRQVIDIILGTDFPGFTRIALLGNHEEYMLQFMEKPADTVAWLQFGGDATLLSYGVSMSPGVATPEKLRDAGEQLKRKVPPRHKEFLSDLQDSYVLGDFMFVHAGIDPNRRLDKQTPRDMRWIREPFLEHLDLYDKVIVHGHSITTKPEFHRNRISLDTGAYHSGCLSCLVLQGNERRLL